MVYERVVYQIGVFMLFPVFVMKAVGLMGSIRGESYLII